MNSRGIVFEVPEAQKQGGDLLKQELSQQPGGKSPSNGQIPS